jgi:hypothetical protein
VWALSWLNTRCDGIEGKDFVYPDTNYRVSTVGKETDAFDKYDHFENN